MSRHKKQGIKKKKQKNKELIKGNPLDELNKISDTVEEPTRR